MKDRKIEKKPAYLTFAEAGKTIPGCPRTHSTVWGWAHKGVKVRGGSRVYLRFIRVGGHQYTTAEWLSAFYDELAQQDREYHQVVQHPNRTEHGMPMLSHREAEKALREMGA